MIGYVTLGSNDKDKAAAFYDAVLGELGAQRIFNNDRLIFWGTQMGAPMIGVGTPFDGNAATAGNGTMIAIPAGSRENVDKVYAKAIAAGAQDEGAPGERMPTFYGGYFRDPDGNKLVVFHMG